MFFFTFFLLFLWNLISVNCFKIITNFHEGRLFFYKVLLCSSKWDIVDLFSCKYLPRHLMINHMTFATPTQRGSNRLFSPQVNYSAFHKTFDKLFWSSLRTWHFHYVVVNQIVNFKTKLWISCWISLGSWEVRHE